MFRTHIKEGKHWCFSFFFALNFNAALQEWSTSVTKLAFSVLQADPSTQMAALASNWLINLWIYSSAAPFIRRHLTRSKHLMSSTKCFCFSLSVSKTAALASDCRSHFKLLLCNCCTDFRENMHVVTSSDVFADCFQMSDAYPFGPLVWREIEVKTYEQRRTEILMKNCVQNRKVGIIVHITIFDIREYDKYVKGLLFRSNVPVAKYRQYFPG